MTMHPAIRHAPKRLLSDLRRWADGRLLGALLLPLAAGVPLAASVWSVNPATRAESRVFFQTIYASSEGVPMGWTGSVASGQPGTTDPAYQAAVIRRVNYFRAMAGVPGGVVLNDQFSAKAQQAALLMSANRALSHYPPENWTWWTAEGYEAAGSSNLSLGDAGAAAVTGYIGDNGDNNSAIGHRRWILYPNTVQMGTGDVPGEGNYPATNALWIMDGNYWGERPATREEFVAWPPPGHVPYPVVFPRWSFALPGADFSAATVSLSRAGTPVDAPLEPLAPGYGDNTLVWRAEGRDASDWQARWNRPESDTTYQVTVANVLVGGQSRQFSYTVTVFDPAVAGPEEVAPVLSGTAQPAVARDTRYTVTPQPVADGYELRELLLAPTQWTEGAEAGFGRLTAKISPGYSAIVSGSAAAGTHAFHLAQPEPDPQYLTVEEELLASAEAQLTFRSRLGWAATGQVARVEVSLDEGSNWSELWRQAGSGGRGETTYRTVAVSLAGLAGKVVRLRFSYIREEGTYYFDTDPAVGWMIDEISVNAQTATVRRVFPVSVAATVTYAPEQAGSFALQARARHYGEYFTAWGPVRPVEAGPGVTGLFPGAIQDGWGIYTQDGFGYFTADYWPWIAHFDHGWLYCAGTAEAWFLYDFHLGWIYTSPALPSFYYAFTDGAWLQYAGRNAGGRVFYRYGANEGWLVAP